MKRLFVLLLAASFVLVAAKPVDVLPDTTPGVICIGTGADWDCFKDFVRKGGIKAKQR
jgi:hypothetical protein